MSGLRAKSAWRPAKSAGRARPREAPLGMVQAIETLVFFSIAAVHGEALRARIERSPRKWGAMVNRPAEAAGWNSRNCRGEALRGSRRFLID